MKHTWARARKQPPKGVMNKTELAYANHLEFRKIAEKIAGWRFEPMKLRLARGWKTTYMPDFQVILLDGHIEFHEVKGFWEDDARVKIKVAAGLYPEYRFIAIKKGKKGEEPWKVEEF